MDVRCDKCQARYRIDDARVGPAGLTMRCGKCGNTFKVTKDGAAAASKPPPAAAPADQPGATMMFVAPKIPPKPAPSAPPAATPAPGPADQPGATMMFVAPKIPPKPAPAPAPKPAPKPAAPAGNEDSGSTMMFGTSPLKATAASAPPAAPAAKPAPKPAASDDSAGSTMMFGSSPLAAKPAPAAAKPAPRPAPPAPAPAPPPKREERPPEPVTDQEREPGRHEEETAGGDEPAAARIEEEPKTNPSRHKPDALLGEPSQARPGEPVGDDDIDPSALTSESSQRPLDLERAPAAKRPLPKAAIVVGIALAALLVLGAIGGILYSKLRPRPPSAAALQALAEGRATLDKDSLALFQQALDSDASAIALAPKSLFPEAHAVQAEIELAWSDALADEAQLLADKSARLDDDKKKADADAASQKAAAESKLHFKTAFDSVKAAIVASPGSPDLHLALADCYRAAKNSNYEKELKKATALKADEGALAEVEGARAMAEDDGADKALAKLKIALERDPQDARAQYRIAQVQALLKNDAEEKKALEATLKLSPTHERAKLMLEAMKAADTAAVPPPPAQVPEGGK